MEGSLTIVYLSLAVILSASTVSSGEAEERQKLREKALTMMNECQKAVGASDEDVQVLVSKKIPTTHEGHCLIECVFSKAGLMKDGKLNKEGAVKVLSPALDGNAAKLEKMKAMMDLCEKEVGEGDGDKCNMARMLVECISKHGEEFGFVIPKPE